MLESMAPHCHNAKMNCRNSLVQFVLLFLVFLIFSPSTSVPSSSRRKSGGGGYDVVNKYGERRQRGERNDRTSRRSSGHRAKSGERRKSNRRRNQEEEDGDRHAQAAAEDKYKYRRNRDGGTSNREDGDYRRQSENKGKSRERRKRHGKQVDASDEKYDQRQSNSSNRRAERRSKSRDGRRSNGARDRHYRRRSRHERDDGNDDEDKRRRGVKDDGEGRRRHSSSSHRERHRNSSRRERSQTRREHKSISKSETHKFKPMDYDEKTVPFLNRYAQQQTNKSADNQQLEISRKSGGKFTASKNAEGQKSLGASSEKKEQSGKREKSGNRKERRSSSRRPKSSTGQQRRSSSRGGGIKEEGRAASGGGRVGVRMGRPVAIGRVVAADAKPKQSELEKAWRKELKVRYNHPIKHVFVESDKKGPSGAKPDKQAIKKINYKIPVNDLFDKQKVLDEMDKIIDEMVEMAASSRIESEDPDLEKEQIDEHLTASIDAKETAQIAYAYKTIIGYCYPELEKMYNNVDAQLKSRHEDLTKLKRNISNEAEKVVKEFVHLSNKIDEAIRSIKKGVRARHEKKLNRLNSKMDMLGEMSQADNVRTAELSESINETGNAIYKVEGEIKHEKKLLKEIEENKKANEKRMIELNKEIEEMQDRNSYIHTYLDTFTQINKLAAEKADLASSLSDLRLDRSYVDRARDIIDAPRDMLRQRKTRQVAAKNETWEEALAAERLKRNLNTMFKNITEKNGTNHYAVYLAQVFTEEDKAALKKIIKDRINAEYGRMKEEAKISKSQSRASSQSRSVTSKSQASRSVRLSRAE